MKKVSIIIPVYNEEKTIIQILKKINLEKKKIKNFIFEIIVINDNSTDKTKELLDKVKNLYDKFLTHDKNYGKGEAVKSGLNICTGEYVLFQDADLEYDPKEYKELRYRLPGLGMVLTDVGIQAEAYPLYLLCVSVCFCGVF